MKNQLSSVIKLTFLCLLFFVAVYSGLILGIAKIIAPNHGKGEVISINGKVVGYASVGQIFTFDRYFWPRPSAVNYNASGSAGSNKGPSNPDYLLSVQTRIDSFLVHNPNVTASQIPSELVTASGSGLDPDISPAAAAVQVARIAGSRGIDADRISDLIIENTKGPLLGLFGPAHINVLELNCALDKLKKRL